ncbi:MULTISPECIES: DNA cytosine methyltransferase [Planktothricoides]|uniref:DNA (cytosine-5-)-methyltransferase n=1 Tax=Planktothricoides raciborskii GIHE-MW2 TaxID=2792601 RepID=A0AAU8JJ14_9CYAN|nr:DNA cytosine methyltransferase [Planktothricoides sp. SR001]
MSFTSPFTQPFAHNLSGHRHRTRPIAVDLFAGVGGFSLGIEQAGFDVVAALDIDPVHAAVYSYNFPHTTVLCADATKVSAKAIENAAIRGWISHPVEIYRHRPVKPWQGEIDLVIGGPPAEGFSQTNKRELQDERNDLVFEFSRLVRELQPRYFVMENVTNLLDAPYDDLRKKLLEDLAAGGYHITQPVQEINARNFGVPQDRSRLFILGTRIGYPLLEYPEFSANDPDAIQVTVGDAIADLPNVDRWHKLLGTDELLLTPEQLLECEQRSSQYARSLRGLIPDPHNLGYPRQWNPQMLTGAMRTVHTEASAKRFATTPMGKVEPQSRLRRLDINHVCPPLRAGTGNDRGRHTSPRPIHPKHPRVISVREAARLHSFPDWFRFHATKWHGFRQVGNALPPLLARAIGAKVVQNLELHPLTLPPDSPALELGDLRLLWMSPSEASDYWQKIN